MPFALFHDGLTFIDFMTEKPIKITLQLREGQKYVCYEALFITCHFCVDVFLCCVSKEAKRKYSFKECYFLKNRMKISSYM